MEKGETFLTISATGRAEARPNEARMQLGVTSQGANAAEASRLSAQTSQPLWLLTADLAGARAAALHGDAATALANVGPGLGAIIGPVGNFAPLPDSAKWILTAGMLLGRLEFFTVIVLMNPNFWRG